jgi:hypothetical protein
VKTQLRPLQRCTSLASLPRSKLCLRSCAGGVHNQLWQKSLWKENERNSKYAAHKICGALTIAPR